MFHYSWAIKAVIALIRYGGSMIAKRLVVQPGDGKSSMSPTLRCLSIAEITRGNTASGVWSISANKCVGNGIFVSRPKVF